MHVKPFSKKNPDAYLGDDELDWKAIMTAAESVGGIEWYIIEYEREIVPPLESLGANLTKFKAMRGCEIDGRGCKPDARADRARAAPGTAGGRGFSRANTRTEDRRSLRGEAVEQSVAARPLQVRLAAALRSVR